MNWEKKRVLVTGASGFIGHHLVARLLELGASVTGVDIMRYHVNDLWDKKLNAYYGVNMPFPFHLPLRIIDLETERRKIVTLLRGLDIDIVFHLGAVFGGRGFVDTRPADCCKGFGINHNVIASAYEAGVDHLHFASSACVYPNKLQAMRSAPLKEDDALSIGDGWESSDNAYGWVKLMAELELKSYCEQYGFKSSVCRYLTVYGPEEFDESHAIATLIQKALRKDDPYIVWGSGNQERGFTYVSDIVNGSILAVEKNQDATPINLGWDKKYKIKDVVTIILELSGHKPKKVIYDLSKPEGPQSRSLDISRGKLLLGWEPQIDIREGLEKTIQWAKAQRR